MNGRPQAGRADPHRRGGAAAVASPPPAPASRRAREALTTRSQPVVRGRTRPMKTVSKPGPQSIVTLALTTAKTASLPGPPDDLVAALAAQADLVVPRAAAGSTFVRSPPWR